MVKSNGKKTLVNVIEAGTKDANPELAIGKKISCWHCFKLFMEELIIRSI